MDMNDVVPVCALIVSTLAFLVSVITIRINLSQKKIDNLVTLHQFLHQDELSEARRVIRENECKMSLADTSVRRVCSSFDFAGTLVRNRAVNRKLFFQYWAKPLNTLSKSFMSIAHMQTGARTTVKQYYRDFYWLLGEAETFDHKRMDVDN